jgi:hypothetical protein
MESLREKIPDVEYRLLIHKLSQQVTEQDLAELKSVFKSCIPKSKREKILKAIELFEILEEIQFVREDDLGDLKELFDQMNKHKLCEIVTNYIRGCRTAESFAESAVRMSNTATLVADPGQKGTAN